MVTGVYNQQQEADSQRNTTKGLALIKLQKKKSRLSVNRMLASFVRSKGQTTLNQAERSYSTNLRLGSNGSDYEDKGVIYIVYSGRRFGRSCCLQRIWGPERTNKSEDRHGKYPRTLRSTFCKTRHEGIMVVRKQMGSSERSDAAIGVNKNK